MSTNGGVEDRPEYGGAYAYSGAVQLAYAPESDGAPDPGEIVWAWVPFQEDDNRGKDRPLLVIGRALDVPGDYVALMLSTRDRSGERGWVLLGEGQWDRRGRESWVKTDRLLRLPENGIRREGAVLRAARFLEVLDKVGREQRGEDVD